MEVRRIAFVIRLYGLVSTVLFFAASPFWVIAVAAGSKKWLDRVGFVSGTTPRASSATRAVWIHASSVGEVRAVTRLVKELVRRPGTDVVVSTMTASGHSVARACLKGVSRFFFLPADAPFPVGRTFERLDPDALILVETELWPCLIAEAKSRGVKVAVVNGRVSDKGMRRYRAFLFLFGPVVALIDAVLVQSEIHAGNFVALGARPERIRITGNTKQDWEAAVGAGLGLRRLAGWGGSEIVFTAGSTRSGEEKVICDGFALARRACESLRLVLAPRHLRRVESLVALADSARFRVTRRSTLLKEGVSRSAGDKEGRAPVGPNPDVVILDTIGELAAAYHESDIAFLGGTLSGHGGHNILEPAAAGIPVLAGSSSYNIRCDYESLERAGALMPIKDACDLAEKLVFLATSEEERVRRGRQAKDLCESRPVSSLLTLEYLEEAHVL
ncbi:MAG: glycosyltransferase N-terminal domain-containing protein [Candidatus Eisenbacteria bacterium]